ncbi:hypothetical protein ILYODFUR_022824, partial [Ilyodon furcidens]
HHPSYLRGDQSQTRCHIAAGNKGGTGSVWRTHEESCQEVDQGTVRTLKESHLEVDHEAWKTL